MINSASTTPAATADQLSSAAHSENLLESSTSIGGAHSISCEQPPVVKLEQTVQNDAVNAQGLNSPTELSMSEAPTASEIRSGGATKRQKTRMLDSDSSDSFLKAPFDLDVALEGPENQSAAAVSDAVMIGFFVAVDLYEQPLAKESPVVYHSRLSTSSFEWHC